jgi:phage-related protein
MEYRITFYESEDGRRPVVDFLEELRTKNPVLRKLLLAGLEKLRRRVNHGEPLTKPVSGSLGILELRVGRTDIARIFFFFQPNQEIVCTHGYVKKTQKLDPNEIARAEHYKADWERRYP